MELSDRPTPETDAAWACFIGYTEPLQDVKDLSCKLERERDEAREALEEWQTLRLWGAEPQHIHDFIKGQQTRIHEAQEIEKTCDKLERERDEARADVRKLQGIKRKREHEELVAAQEIDRLKQERDEARRAVAKWESSFDAMERAGAEQARRAHENREWALRAEQERDEAREQLRNCGQHMIQVSEELDAGEGEIALDAAVRAMGLLRRAERERDEAREAFAVATDQLVQAQSDLREAREQRDLLVQAIDECMLVSNLGVFNLGDDAKVALHKICCWQQEVGSHYAKEAAK